MTEIKVGIDTIILVAKTNNDIQLHNEFYLSRKHKYFKYYCFQKGKYNLMIGSKNPYNMFYDTMLILQADAIHTPPPEILRILQRYEWYIKRLDSAFDTVIPLNPYPSNFRKKLTEYKGTFYIGVPKSQVSLCCYNRNEKEKARGHGTRYEYNHRHEVRWKPKQQYKHPLKSLDYTELEKILQDINLLDLKENRIKSAYKTMIDNPLIMKKSSNAKLKREIKKEVSRHRIPLEKCISEIKQLLTRLHELQNEQNTELKLEGKVV